MSFLAAIQHVIYWIYYIYIIIVYKSLTWLSVLQHELRFWHIFKKTCFKKGSEDFFRKIIYKKKAIFKTRNKRTGNGMRWMRGTRGMFIGIPGNFSEDSGKCYYFNIRGNVEEDSGECSKIFQGMLVKIPGNAREDSREYWQRYSRMLKRTERFNAIQWK